MKIERISIDKINPALYNPRVDLKPGDDEYERIKKSIDDFGLVEVLVWNKHNGILISGHQRLKILKARGDTKIPVSVVNIVDEKKEKALNIILNNDRVAGGWDFTKLADLLMELDDGQFDMDMTGFSEEEREDIATYTPPDNRGDVKVRKAYVRNSIKCPECGHEF